METPGRSRLHQKRLTRQLTIDKRYRFQSSPLPRGRVAVRAHTRAVPSNPVVSNAIVPNAAAAAEPEIKDEPKPEVKDEPKPEVGDAPGGGAITFMYSSPAGTALCDEDEVIVMEQEKPLGSSPTKRKHKMSLRSSPRVAAPPTPPRRAQGGGFAGDASHSVNTLINGNGNVVLNVQHLHF